jgi:non-canonical (house-cleaning) NTP pyrophosphatase
MSDFNAPADVYCHVVKPTTGHQPMLPPKPVHSGTVAECIKWVMAKREYQETYFMTVPLEAGFIKNELGYFDIKTISHRPDFPK